MPSPRTPPAMVKAEQAVVARPRAPAGAPHCSDGASAHNVTSGVVDMMGRALALLDRQQREREAFSERVAIAQSQERAAVEKIIHFGASMLTPTATSAAEYRQGAAPSAVALKAAEDTARVVLRKEGKRRRKADRRRRGRAARRSQQPGSPSSHASSSSRPRSLRRRQSRQPHAPRARA